MNSNKLSTLVMNRINLRIIQSKLNPSSSSQTRPLSTVSNPPNNNLYAHISPLGNPSINLQPILDKWKQDGKKLRIAELQRIIRDLRKRRRLTQALQVSEWIGDRGIIKFSAREHAVQLDLIGTVRGLESAESYFNNLSDEEKTEKTYGALLNCYCKAKLADKALSLAKKMKELNFFSTLGYNDLMCLYTNTKEYEEIPNILNEMKEDGVSPDNFSYRICMNSYGIMSNIQGVENILEEMENQKDMKIDWNTYTSAAHFYIKAGLTDKAVDLLKKAEEKLDKKDRTPYNHLISHYASLGKLEEVMRLWKLKKETLKKTHINADYVTMLGSLVKLEEIAEAENLLLEWQSSGNAYDFRVPNVLLIAYSKRGMLDKAESLLEHLSEKGEGQRVPSSWEILAMGYVKKEEMQKAMECMNKAISFRENDKGWKPNDSKMKSSLLVWLGENGGVEEVESFVESLKQFNDDKMDKDMYKALIKANVRAGQDPHEILESMKADNIEEDEEIKEMLSLNHTSNLLAFL